MEVYQAILRREESIQIAVCNYIRLAYPKAIFTAESSGLKLPIGLAVKAKKQRNPSRGLPDLIILEPRGGYHGLCLELKQEDANVFLKNGKLSSNTHIQEQADCLFELTKRGYYAAFALGVDDAIKTIDNYMRQTHKQ